MVDTIRPLERTDRLAAIVWRAGWFGLCSEQRVRIENLCWTMRVRGVGFDGPERFDSVVTEVRARR